MGCLVKDKLKRIALATFDIKAKNFITEANDKIHSNKKRNNDNYKRSYTVKKVKKLSSNKFFEILIDMILIFFLYSMYQ